MSLSVTARAALFFAAAWAAGTAASASEGERPDTDAIVVTGTGLQEPAGTVAYATTRIDRDRLLSAPSGRIEDALAGVAGFQQFRRSDSRSSNPSAQGVTLRALGGNATSRALVLLDGVPMTDPFFGYVPFSALAPERLASGRITRGGGSGPFGAGALAGTIELESAGTEAIGLASASALANDRGETEVTATLAPQLGAGFAVVSGRWDRGQGFWTTPADQRVPASARARFDSRSLQLRGIAPLSPNFELQARMLVFEDSRTLRFDGADTTIEGQDASLRLVGRGAWGVDAVAYVQARDFSNVVVSATRFVPVLVQRSTPATGLGGKLEIRPPVGGGHGVRLGVDYRRSTGSLREESLSTATGAVTERRTAGGTTSDLGLFIEDNWTTGPLVLTGGVRADRTSATGGYFNAARPDGVLLSGERFVDRAQWLASVRGGALLRASAEIDLRAAAYTGLRLPTLNELYRPFTVFPVTTLANAALSSERLTGFEAGLDWRPAEGLSLSVTAFDNRVKGAIANVTIGPNLRQRQNIDAIAARGLEVAAGIERGALRFDGSLAYTDATARGSGAAILLDGKRPAQTPRWAASATVEWRPAGGARAALTVRHVGAQFEDDLESDILPSATTLDGFATLPLGGGLSLVVRAENLTDTTVVTRNQGGSIDLGAPRTLWAGLRLGY